MSLLGGARLKPIRRLVASLAFVAATVTGVLAVTTPRAHAVTVVPVILELRNGGSQSSAVFTVDDSFATPLPVELTITKAKPSDGGLDDTGVSSDDLLVFPPQAIIQPGKTQAFRVQWVGDPAIKQSQHYYVTISQVPVQLPEDKDMVQVLYDFQVIVNVGLVGARPRLSVANTEIQKDDKGVFHPVVSIVNTSNTYGYLENGTLKVTVTDSAGKQIASKTYTPDDVHEFIGPGLVAAGQTRPFTIPMVLPNGEGKVAVSFRPSEN